MRKRRIYNLTEEFTIKEVNNKTVGNMTENSRELISEKVDT